MINDVIANPAINTFFAFLNSFHNTGKKKPKGTNNNTFKHALLKSFIIYIKGII